MMSDTLFDNCVLRGEIIFAVLLLVLKVGGVSGVLIKPACHIILSHFGIFPLLSVFLLVLFYRNAVTILIIILKYFTFSGLPHMEDLTSCGKRKY